MSFLKLMIINTCINSYFRFVTLSSLGLTTLIFVSPSISHAQSWCNYLLGRTNQISAVGRDGALSLLAQNYIDLARRERFHKQSGNLLKAIGLQVEGGGLCASACLANIALTALEDTEALGASFTPEERSAALIGYFISNYEKAIREIAIGGGFSEEDLNQLKKKHPTILDGRYGALHVILSRSTKSFFQSIGVESIEKNLNSEENFKTLSRSGILYVSADISELIQSQIRPDLNRIGGHMLAVLSVDTKTKKIIYADPNQPNRIIEVEYHTSEGKLYFVSPISYSDKGKSIFTISIDSAATLFRTNVN